MNVDQQGLELLFHNDQVSASFSNQVFDRQGAHPCLFPNPQCTRLYIVPSGGEYTGGEIYGLCFGVAPFELSGRVHGSLFDFLMGVMKTFMSGRSPKTNLPWGPPALIFIMAVKLLHFGLTARHSPRWRSSIPRYLIHRMEKEIDRLIRAPSVYAIPSCCGKEGAQ